MFHFGSAKAF
jgi:hypothetical protein